MDRIHSSLPKGIKLSLGTSRMPIHREDKAPGFEVKERSVSPLNGFFLFLNHVCQLLEDGAQLNNCGLNVLHGVCPALDVRILQRRESVHEQQELLRVGPASLGLSSWPFHPWHMPNTCL